MYNDVVLVLSMRFWFKSICVLSKYSTVNEFLKWGHRAQYYIRPIPFGGLNPYWHEKKRAQDQGHDIVLV
jgi:hypothetical protein